MVVMNIFIVCFLGNHVSNALQHPDEMFSKHPEDSIQKTHQYDLSVSSNTNKNPNNPEPTLLGHLVGKNLFYTKTDKINLRSGFFDNVIFGFILNEPLNWHVEGDQNYSENSDEDETIIATSVKELGRPESQGTKSINWLVENKYNMETMQNYPIFGSINTVRKGEIKHKIISLKIDSREQERNAKYLTDFDSSHLFDEINSQENKYHESSGTATLNEGEEEVNCLRKGRKNTLIEDNLHVESLEGTQGMDIRDQDSDSVLSKRSVYSKLTNRRNEKQYSIKTLSLSSSVKVQQQKYNKFGFHPNLFKSILTSPYQYHSPSLILRALVPKQTVKRSLPSADTRQLEIPTVGRFPFSTAGSSLYGSYAYAQSRPAGFGISTPNYGGEGEEITGEPTEGGEEGNE